MRKKLKNKIIALAILTSIIIIAVVFISKSKTQNTKVDENNKFFNAEKGDLPVLIVQTGQLKASQSYKIKAPIIPGISRDLKLEWIVSEGSKVKKDEVIAKLDREPIQQDIDNLTAELESEKALLSIEKENFKIQESQNILNLNTAKINLENSGNELKKYNTLELPTQINEFEVKTNAAKIKYEEAQKNLKNLQQQAESQLFVESSQEADTKKKVEDAKKIVENAKTLLESTELEYKIFKRYTSPEQLGNKMTAYEKAKMDLERTKVTSGSSIIQIQERIRQKERTIKDKETKSKKSKEYLEQLILKALVDGLVIYKDVDLPYWRASTDEMKEGKIVRPGEVIITIPDLSAYEVSVEIGEESRSKLKEKMDGTIKIEAIPDLILHGTIKTISNLARSSAAWDPSSPKVYDIIFTLGDCNEEMKPGMSAKVEILIEKLKDVLYIPIEAVYESEDEKYCYVKTSAGPEKRIIKAGKSNDSFIVIIDGLKKGETVYLFNPIKKD